MLSHRMALTLVERQKHEIEHLKERVAALEEHLKIAGKIIDATDAVLTRLKAVQQ